MSVRKGKKLKRERYWRSLEKLKMSVYCLVTLQQEIQPTCIIKKSNRFFPVREKNTGKTTEVGSSPTQELKIDRHTPTG